MTMTSLLNQLPILDFTPSSKSHLSPPTTATRCDHNNNSNDIEDGGSQGSLSLDGGEWETANTTTTTTSATTTKIRSRVNKGRSASPTQSTGSIDYFDRLPLLLSTDSSSDSEDCHNEPSTPSSPGASTTAYIVSWIKLLGVASVLTTLMYLSPSFFLETAYFPARGRMFPGALNSLITTPVFDYHQSPAANVVDDEGGIHIPRIVHVTYKSREELPEEWELSIQQWEKTHPDWQVRFWSDRDIEEFVHTQYPQYEALHKSYKYVIQRVDSVRYMILHHYGGLYSDMDIYPAVSLDKLLQQWEDAGKSVLLAETSNMGVTNAFMASAPGSTFMKCAVENLPHFQHKWHHQLHWRHWEVLSSAGSTYLWGMVGHCPNQEVEILAARSFRGCSVCDAWETGKPSETCDTQWLHHSSTNSSWHQHGSWFHSFMTFFTYSFLCEPFRACFLCVTLFLIVAQKRWNRNKANQARQ